jgi:glycosyltransferase involved in cell wall biosynthesis
VLNLTAGQDTGGQIYRTAQAAERHSSSLIIESYVRGTSYIEWPTAPYVRRWTTRGEIVAAWRWAEVIHVHNDLRPHDGLRWDNPRPTLIHHHGSKFRAKHRELVRQIREARALGAVSTVDLLEYGNPGELQWLPSPFDVEALAAIRRRVYRPDELGRVHIVHAPTNRPLKGTATVLEAIAALEAQGAPITFDLIERATWNDTLERKARADIFVDQLYLGYGGNAVEAMAMGIPVVAGCPPEYPAILERHSRRPLPFYRTEPSGLEHVLGRLIESATLRAAWARRGRRYVEAIHDYAPAIARLEALYCKAIRRWDGGQ